MKILFLQDDFPPQSFGGAGIVAFNLAKALQKKGHQVFVITTTQKKNQKTEEEYFGLKIYQIYSNYHERWRAYLSLYNPQTVKPVKEIIKKIRPDIIHVHNIHTYLSYYCLKIAKKHSNAVFLTAHDVMLVHYGKWLPKNVRNFKISFFDKVKSAKKRYNPFRDIVIKHYLKYVDKIFAVSDSLKNILKTNGIRNIATVYNGIDVNNWRENPETAEKFRETYDLSNKKAIFFIGRLSEPKGGGVIVKAMEYITEKIPSAFLIVAGKKGAYAQKMIKLAQKLGVENNIIFTGWIEREEAKTAYSCADVVVTPSIYPDPFNLINIEAMAVKKPVVGTCFGGTREIILDRQTGYIVNPNKIKIMSEKIVDLLNNSDRAEKFGQAGYERVKKKFSLEKQVIETLKWYEKYI